MITCRVIVLFVYLLLVPFIIFIAPGAVGHLSFTDILDTSLKVSWKEPQEKNGLLTGNFYSSLYNNDFRFMRHRAVSRM